MRQLTSARLRKHERGVCVHKPEKESKRRYAFNSFFVFVPSILIEDSRSFSRAYLGLRAQKSLGI
jgi:hypothetical protein